jgi:hypothetical protein
MKDLGKHLFLLLVAFILLMGIYISYNSSAFSLSSRNSVEHFSAPSPLYPEPIKFKLVNINKDSIDLEFSPPPIPSNPDGSIPIPMPQLINYCIIIASMNDKGAVINGQRMFLQPINTCVLPDVPDTTLPENQRNICKYTIPINQGVNEVSFKAGLMAVYDIGDSTIIDPSNIQVFKLGLSLPDNINVYNAGLDAIKAQQKINSSIMNNDNKNLLCTADGQFELIRQSLGGYPDNLYISQEIGQDTLAAAVNKQLSLGIINVNVKN